MSNSKQKQKGSNVNDDGLEPGAEVDFETLQRILTEQRNGTTETKEDDAS